MSVHLPEKIENCPIVEAVFEIRYSSKYPEDAIFGVLYAAVKDFFTEKINIEKEVDSAQIIFNEVEILNINHIIN